MAHTTPLARAARSTSDRNAPASAPVRYRRTPAELQFPGCRPIPLRRDQLADFDGRLEYWEARTQTAWVLAEPTGGIHESTSRRLPELARLIATVRGSPIRAFGSVDLRVNDDAGRPDRIMQADETLYLHPRRARMPSGPLVIGVHDLPDIVLEVDQTTDIRQGKLPLYEAWGFPELWMLVPPAGATSRRPAGVTIHRLEGDRYEVIAESVAFPGWTAPEIHVALTEPLTTKRTCEVLERVGRTLGAREGTGPQDDPLLRVLGNRERAEGKAEGRATGQAELVRALLAERGIPVSESFTARAAKQVDSPGGARMAAAALVCTDEADFWQRLDRP